MKKRVFAILSACIMMTSTISVYGKEIENSVDETSIYEAVSDVEVQSQEVNLASGVTEEMCQASFWSGMANNPSEILMDRDEIEALNKETVQTKAAMMYDLVNMPDTYDGNAEKERLVNEEIPGSTFYIDGEEIEDVDAYFQDMRDNIKNTESTEEDHVKYAVAVEYADMKSWPTTDMLGYSSDDTDDELQLSALCVNEPFVAKTFTSDGKFCWGYTTNCSGWVSTDSLAFCSSKEEWTDAWQVDIHDDDYLVVTTNKILLENSRSDASVANVLLTLGTTLKRVPQNEIPESVLDRGTWNNYVVYLPTRDEDGNYVKKYALISMHYNVSNGYLDLTQENVMKVAFECLGDRYGWGGMLTALDCSAYSRMVYRCFGLEIPRNTTWQQAIPGHKIDISEMTDEEKVEQLKQVPIGSLVYMNGHVVIYTGNYNDCAYAISATGSLADSAEGAEFGSQQNIILNPLTVKRWNGTTWLSNMISIVSFGDIGTAQTDLNTCEIEVNADQTVYSGEEQKPQVIVKDGDTILNENESYTVSYSDNVLAGEAKVTITGMGNYTGTVEKTFTIQKAVYTVKAEDYNGKYDGKPHSISISGVKDGSAVEYRVSEEDAWSTEAPARVEAGTTTVYYQITNPNYETISGKQAIIITADEKKTSAASGETPEKKENTASAKKQTSTVKTGDDFSSVYVMMGLLVFSTAAALFAYSRRER